MRPMIFLLVITLTTGGTFAARAAESPYVGEEERPIKALSADEVEGYLAGAGMGFAKVAELNQYPGPLHVLELAEPLGLTDAQRAVVEAAERRMKQRAVELGRRLVEAEAALDHAFAAATVDRPDLARRLHQIADLEAEIRLAHLAAHLETRAVLEAAQIARYDHLRGYAGAAPGDGHQEEGHHHGGAAHGGHGGAAGGSGPAPHPPVSGPPG